MGLIPLPYRILIAAALFVALVTFIFIEGRHYEKKQWEARVATLELAASKQATKDAQTSTEVVTKYVDRIQTVEKRVPVVRDRIVRLCDGGSGQPIVPGAARAADAPAGANASDRLAGLAADAVACKTNSERLAALQEWAVRTKH